MVKIDKHLNATTFADAKEGKSKSQSEKAKAREDGIVLGIKIVFYGIEN